MAHDEDIYNNEDIYNIMNAEFAPSRTLVSDFLMLIKFRIGLMVVFSTFVGYVLGTGTVFSPIALFHVLFATFLTTSGTGVLNQVMERECDGRMWRTADRPLPAGRIAPEAAYWFGLILSGMGIVYLGVLANWLTGVMGALTVVVYLLVYTPLKPKTAHNTAVGAIAGALPPVGGWTAATGVLSGEALALFGILFLWQFPHFLSIAWLYREDYARGGLCMLPVEDPQGDRTAHQMVLYSLVLLSCSLMPALLGMAGVIYFGVAILLGFGLLQASFTFARSRTDEKARRVMRATLIYLPVLWLVMMLDKIA